MFTSRFGLLVAALGMAVGTGNIWRFPRIAAMNGGGAFLIPWLIFLFLWAIPLLMVESAMGRKARYGVVGSFAKLIGRNRAWLGCFVAWCTMGILFYYSVVAGWCVKYLVGGALGELTGADGMAYWETFQSTGWEPVLFHLIAMGLGAGIVYQGVVAGIERASRVLIPTLFVLLLVACGRAVTLPGSSSGLEFLFNPDWADLLDYRIWLEGLTQSAWSTGAGWGLLLTYAAYMREEEDIVMNSLTIGLGNNSASLLAGIAVIPTVFALMPVAEATELVQRAGPASTGLTFIWIPELFARVPGGEYFVVLFFLALVVAALSSMISMIELATRVFMDAGMSRRRALLTVASGGFLLGLPSALSLSFFANQDAVWGIGLMVSGFFFAVAVRGYGPARFREELIETVPNDLPVGRWFDFALRYLIPAEFMIMLAWWLWQAATSGEAWWNPFGVFTLGTCLFQWGLALVLFRIFNDAIADRTLGGSP